MLALGRDLSVAEVNKIFSAHGSDSAGMDHEAFISYMKDMKEKTASPEEIKDALSVFDISANKDSTISIDELVNAMKEMGDKNDLLSSRECEILIDRADIDGDMKLNYREFVDYMMKQIWEYPTKAVSFNLNYHLQAFRSQWSCL